MTDAGYFSKETTEHLKAVLVFKKNLFHDQESKFARASLNEDMAAIERELRTRGATLPV